MEIKIRNVDPVAVKKIDELAKRKGLSREKFLKQQIETLAFFREQTERETHLQTVIEKNILAMNTCYESMDKMNELISMIIQEEEEEEV